MGFLKVTNTTKSVDDTPEVVNDFRRQIPFWSYRPVEYRSYAPFVNLGIILDDYLEKLFTGELDEGNGDVLDNIIFDSMRQAFHDLDVQKAQHEDLIENLFLQIVGARDRMTTHKASIDARINEVREELDDIRKRFVANKFERSAEIHEAE